MKKTLGKYAAAIVLLFISFSSFSQDSNMHDDNTQRSTTKTPVWVSDNGYWMMENNINHPKQSIVRFYNNQNVFIGQQEITGKEMNVKRKKIKMQLKAMLESSLVAWNKAHPATNNTDVAKKP